MSPWLEGFAAGFGTFVLVYMAADYWYAWRERRRLRRRRWDRRR